MQRPRSTQPSRPSTSRPKTPRPSSTRSSSGRPATARNYHVEALDTGFYPQCQTPRQDELMKQWASQGYQWYSCCDGQMPIRAVQNGQSRAGEPLYVARALSPGMTLCLGIFHPSSRKCYFLWEGREYCSSTYEILCRMPKLQARASPMATSIPAFGDSLKVMTLRNPLKFSNFSRK